MKLSECHSCDLFPEGKQLTGEAIPIYRECTSLSITILRETACQIVRFVEILEQHFLDSGIGALSPLVLHCIYRACAVLAWMALERNSGEYAAGKAMCVEILCRFNLRWKAAGNTFNIFPFVSVLFAE